MAGATRARATESTHHGGVDGGEARGGHLRLHDGAREQPAPAHQILAENLREDVLEVGDVHLRW
jgi:hypothetical protein